MNEKRKIIMLSDQPDKFDSKIVYHKGTEIDLGKERNELAVKKGKAKWAELKVEVDSSEFQKLVTEKQTEKKEGTPKKTTSSVKGKKINTK